MEKYEQLIGETVQSFSLNPDRDQLTLTMKSGNTFVLETEGDCCSITWIEHIDGEEALTGTIQQVNDIPMPGYGDVPTLHRPVVDVVGYYGLQIITNNGYSVIDYRNDSNGYYGGSISLRKV